MTIKDQDLSKNNDLLENILVHIVDQANFTIANLRKRKTIGRLMECENCLTDMLPIVKLVAENDLGYTYVYEAMKQALCAAQTGQAIEDIPLDVIAF